MVHRFLASRQDGAPPMPPRSPEYLAENLAPRLLAVEGSLFAITMTVVLMRFYVRIFMLKMFGWDDWMMVISAALNISCLGLFVKVINLGLGRHAEAFPLENLAPFFKYIYFYSILIIAAYSFIKLSIGFFLLRLADRTKWRTFLIGMLFFIGAFTIGSLLAIIFQCIPVKAGYDYSLRPPTGTAKCYSGVIFKNVGVFNSSINIATDLLFALIPIPMVWKLQVNLQTRISLAVILSLGLFASGVAIYKTPMQYNFFKETDWSGHGSWYYIWQQVEMNVGTVAACLPTLKPLFSNFFGHIRTFTKARTSRTTGSGISAPFKSGGYIRHPDGQEQGSFAMKSLGESSQSRSRDPYEEDAILGKDKMYGVEVGRGRLGRDRSPTGDSDESILSHDGPGRRSQPRGMTIIKTTEVNVSG